MLEFAERIRRLMGNQRRRIIDFEPLPEDDPKKRQPDITKAKRVLGWEPKVDLEDGLRETVEVLSGALTTVRNRQPSLASPPDFGGPPSQLHRTCRPTLQRQRVVVIARAPYAASRRGGCPGHPDIRAAGGRARTRCDHGRVAPARDFIQRLPAAIAAVLRTYPSPPDCRAGRLRRCPAFPASVCSKSAETACSNCSASSWTLYHSMPKISVSMRSIR